MTNSSSSSLSFSQKIVYENYGQIKKIPTKQVIQKKSKIILGFLDKAYKQLKQDLELGTKNFINKISQILDQQKVDKMLNKLSEGYIVDKHSKNTNQPHRKFLFLSSDRRYLCWRSIDKSNQKAIQLKKIEFIAQGNFIKQWRTSSTMKERLMNCFVIISQSRTLQIQCCDQNEAEKLVEQIQEAVKNSRRMHLSYNF